MQEGRLDAYRAGVVAHELEGCPAEVGEAVVAAVDPYLDGEPGPALRRRTRRVLVRISPDLLRQRVERSRRETGLHRWVGEPGVDVWHGTFPSEESAAAWSAIDRLARQYVLEGTCPTIERARGRALTDLVLEHSDDEVQVVLTVPAETVPPEAEAVPEAAGSGGREATACGPGAGECSATGRAPDADGGRSADATRRVAGDEDLVQVFGARPSEPVLVPAGWLRRHSAGAARAVCDPTTGARLDVDDRLGCEVYRPGERLVALVRARDGRCRCPGCRVAARFCDLDHVRPWPGGPTAASNLVCLCRRHHRVKQSTGWRLRLLPDGTAEWADPTGDVRRTEPLDALDGLVLHAFGDVGGRLGGGTAATAEERAALLPSTLEEHLELLVQRREAACRADRTRAAPAARPALEASAHDPPPF